MISYSVCGETSIHVANLTFLELPVGLGDDSVCGGTAAPKFTDSCLFTNIVSCIWIYK